MMIRRELVVVVVLLLLLLSVFLFSFFSFFVFVLFVLQGSFVGVVVRPKETTGTVFIVRYECTVSYVKK